PVFKNAAGTVLPVGLVDGNGAQVLNQLAAVGVTIGVALAGSLVILKLVDLFVGLRVTEGAEVTGLDASLHGEEGYDFGLEAAFALNDSADFAPDYSAGGVAFEGAAGD